MSAKSTAMSLGAITGFAMAFRDYRRDLDRNNRDTETTSDNALGLALDSQRRLDQMLQNGDFMRLADNRFADLGVGLCFPDQSAPTTPSAFASVPAPFPPPDLSESLAIAPNMWPGPVNVYKDNGLLANPSAALVGQNVATGIALGNPAVRSSLMGYTETTMPTANKLAQLHRFHRSLVLALGQFEAAPLSLANFYNMWVNLLKPAGTVGPAGFPSGLISCTVANSPVITNTTAETVLGAVLIPPGCVGIGQAIVAELSGLVTSSGSGHGWTFRARVNQISGAILLVTPVTVYNTNDLFKLSVELDRGADASGFASCVVTPEFAAPTLAGTGSSGLFSSITFDPTQVNSIVFTAQCAGAASGDSCMAQKQLLRKL